MGYVVNIESDEPIMLIDKHIGFDETDGQGIDGAQFARELMALDAMGKKSIRIWINSPGGIVMDGYSIYNAILKTKTKVDTVCVGIAASIAAVIFQAGRKRVMNEYALLMYHNPYGGNSAELKPMRESIAQMISGRTDKPIEDILKMMDRTTWIKASEAFENGFADEIEVSAEFNKKRVASEPMAMWRESSLIINSLFNPKNTKMNKVTNKLGLVVDANEDSIIEAITQLENKAASAEDRFKKLQEEHAAAKAKCEELENQMNGFKKKAEEAEEEKKMAEADAKKANAKNMIEGFAKAGKIKNEAIDKWMNMAIVDFDGTKELLDELPINKTANKMAVVEGAGSNDANLTMVVANKMHEIRQKQLN